MCLVEGRPLSEKQVLYSICFIFQTQKYFSLMTIKKSKYEKPLLPHSAIQTHCIVLVMCNMSPVGSAEREQEQPANGFTFEASAVILVCVQEVLCVMLGQVREREPGKSHS